MLIKGLSLNILSISRFVTLTPALSQRARESLVSPLLWERGGGEGALVIAPKS